MALSIALVIMLLVSLVLGAWIPAVLCGTVLALLLVGSWKVTKPEREWHGAYPLEWLDLPATHKSDTQDD